MPSVQNGADLGALGDEYNKSPCREESPRLLKDKTHRRTTLWGIQESITHVHRDGQNAGKYSRGCRWTVRFVFKQSGAPFPARGLIILVTKRPEISAILNCASLWLAKWCKIHKVYMHSHSMFLLIFTNIFIHIQQSNLHSRNIFIHIYLCISYSRLYLLTFTRCLEFIHIQRAISIHIHDRNIHSTFSAHHLCASVSIKHGLRTTDYGLRTTDYGLRTTD